MSLVGGDPVLTPVKGIPYSGTVLTSLEEEGILRPGRENKLGRGFYYVPAT